MIQRIQTVYLLLIFGLMLTMPFLPVATIKISEILSFDLKLWETLLAAFAALAAIFLYKNRKTQLIVCYAIMGLLLLSYVFIFFDLWINTQEEGLLQLKAPVVFPLFAIILDILAVVSIQKDEKLVHSADRLR
jgi:peptidoglycan/LPS O-acetylase OafA/YrhL